MKKDEILKSLKEFSQKPIFPKILISVGLVIMVMIVFADFSGSKDKKSVSDTDADFQTADTYIECAYYSDNGDMHLAWRIFFGKATAEMQVFERH
jgi:hypothetical protein